MTLAHSAVKGGDYAKGIHDPDPAHNITYPADWVHLGSANVEGRGIYARLSDALERSPGRSSRPTKTHNESCVIESATSPEEHAIGLKQHKIIDARPTTRSPDTRYARLRQPPWTPRMHSAAPIQQRNPHPTTGCVQLTRFKYLVRPPAVPFTTSPAFMVWPLCSLPMGRRGARLTTPGFSAPTSVPCSHLRRYGPARHRDE